MARAGLQGLQNFSKHGFIHGDIKPENMIWDTNSQTLRVIDLDGMRKISKKPGSEIPQASGLATKTYLHPMKINKQAAVGVGRDLFAFGLTLLETAVLAKGSGDNRSFKHLQDYLTNDRARGLVAWAEGRQQIVDRIDRISQGYSEDSVEHFALQAIKTAIEYKGNRLQNGLKSYDRWQANDASHPLNLLAQNSAVFEL